MSEFEPVSEVSERARAVEQGPFLAVVGHEGRGRPKNGTSLVTMRLSEDLLQLYGVVHGGALAEPHRRRGRRGGAVDAATGRGDHHGRLAGDVLTPRHDRRPERPRHLGAPRQNDCFRRVPNHGRGRQTHRARHRDLHGFGAGALAGEKIGRCHTRASQTSFEKQRVSAVRMPRVRPPNPSPTTLKTPVAR